MTKESSKDMVKIAQELRDFSEAELLAALETEEATTALIEKVRSISMSVISQADPDD